MDAIRIVPDRGYEGEGRSLGLARGLLVFYGDQNLTGEGMGIGSVAIRDRTGTYFCRSSGGWADEAGKGRTYTLDTRIGWAIGGRPSPLLSRGVEAAVGAYMHVPSLQRLLMLPVQPLRRRLGISPVFQAVPPVGRVTVDSEVKGGRIDVRAGVYPPLRPGSVVCLLNELSADWFTAAVRDGAPAPPPPGWEPLGPGDPPAQLYDPSHGLRFTLTEYSVPPDLPARTFWGRERIGDLCWAGFCLELGPLGGLRGPFEARYGIDLSGGGIP